MARSKRAKSKLACQAKHAYIRVLEEQLKFTRFQMKAAFLLSPLLGAWLGMRLIQIWLLVQGYELDEYEWNDLSFRLAVAAFILMFVFVLVGQLKFSPIASRYRYLWALILLTLGIVAGVGVTPST